jgi:pilus assembly protein CpaE
MIAKILTRRALQAADRLWRDRTGASAVEIGLVAPMLVVGLLSMVDIGRAVNERIALENVLRAGARVAISDPGAEAVRNAIGVVESGQRAATARGALTFDAQRYCACTDDTATARDCDVTCAGALPTAIFYRLTSSTTYDGMLLPSMRLGAETRVRIR